MASPGPEGVDNGSEAKTACKEEEEEAKRGTKRPADVAVLDQEAKLKPIPAKLHKPETVPTSDSSNTPGSSEPRSSSSQETGASPSEPGELQYCLVNEESQIPPALEKLRERSEKHPFLAVDCEAEHLGRRGKLSIVAVATYSHTYLFDIVTLGAKVFDDGLRELLEDPGRQKLMFDCRRDSDCLWHLFKVKLANVLDLQLLQFIESYSFPIRRRCHINGYRKCLAVYVGNANLTKVKDEGSSLMGEGGTGWMKRPLKDQLLKYAALDVQGFFLLYDKLKPALGKFKAKTRLQRGSQQYLGLFRDKPHRTYDSSEQNSYLPPNVFDY